MSIQNLKKAICERQEEAFGIRRKIQASTGKTRAAAWDKKRAYGYKTRYVLLVYGFARGLTYQTCEPHCADENYPSPVAIERVAREFGIPLLQGEALSWLTGVPFVEEKSGFSAPTVVQALPQDAPVQGSTGLLSSLRRLLGVFAS